MYYLLYVKSRESFFLSTTLYSLCVFLVLIPSRFIPLALLDSQSQDLSYVHKTPPLPNFIFFIFYHFQISTFFSSSSMSFSSFAILHAFVSPRSCCSNTLHSFNNLSLQKGKRACGFSSSSCLFIFLWDLMLFLHFLYAGFHTSIHFS